MVREYLGVFSGEGDFYEISLRVFGRLDRHAVETLNNKQCLLSERVH